jgi:exopolyphosphatase/guanosine-5'-triphosphate,3'-diphosphate pyrophosphatase
MKMKANRKPEPVGLLDIGSNTIKAFIYEAENGRICTLAHHAYHTQLLNYIRDDALSEEGLNAAISDINALVAFLESNGCKTIYSFATEALRSCKNAERVCFEILAQTGVNVSVLTGRQEARCDYESLKQVAGVPFFSGVDIGGGSCQAVVRSENGVYYNSFPIGALRLAQLFMDGDCPNAAQENRIAAYAAKNLSRASLGKGRTLYAMGGSAFALQRIAGGAQVSCSDLNALLSHLRNLGDGAFDYLKANAPGRETTLAAGAIILRTAAQSMDAQTIQIMQNGVREGYLLLKSRGILP